LGFYDYSFYSLSNTLTDRHGTGWFGSFNPLGFSSYVVDVIRGQIFNKQSPDFSHSRRDCHSQKIIEQEPQLTTPWRSVLSRYIRHGAHRSPI